MPKMPLDVMSLLDSVANVGQERDLPVYVDLVFDPTASDKLIDYVIDAFVSIETEAFVEHIILGTTVPDLPVPCDLCVIVGGDSLLLGDTAAAARSKGIPAVVAIARGETYFANDPKSAQALADATLSDNTILSAAGTSSAPAVGKGIPVDGIIDVDVNAETDRPLEELGSWIVTHAPAKRISMAANFPFLRHPLSVELIQQNAIQNGAIGFVFFIPGADMPLITLNQAKLVIQIAAIYGQPLGYDRIKEVLCVVAGAFGCRALSRRLVAGVPVLGWAIKPTVAAGGTVAMGTAALEYFDRGELPEGVRNAAAKSFSTLGDFVDRGAGYVENVMDGYLAHRSWKKPAPDKA